MNKLIQVKEIRWEVVVSFKTEFLTECLAQSSFYKVEKKLGLPLSRELIFDNDIAHDFGQLSISRSIIRKDIKKNSQKIFSEIERQSRIFVALSKKLSSINLGLATNKKLLVNTKKWFDCYGDTVGLINVPGRLDEALEEEIRKDLEERGVKDLEKILRSVARAERLSGVTEEKLELMKLVSRGIINREKIKKHAEKYNWINITLLLGDLYEVKDVKEKIKQLKRQDLKSKIRELESIPKEARKQLSDIIKQYKFKPSLSEKIIILRRAVWFRTARLDWLNKGCALARPLFLEIAKRLGLTYEELIYCSPEEIITALSQNKRIKEKKLIVQRMKKYAMWTLDGRKYHFVTGESVESLEKSLCDKFGETKEIKGITAYGGKVTGIVRKLKDRSEINKLKKGEILVTRLTTPDFVPAIEKAAAIITDLGGITSHAAIASRELKKSCIVGTKIATQVLKNGGLVEVDADRGVIKIIK